MLHSAGFKSYKSSQIYCKKEADPSKSNINRHES